MERVRSVAASPKRGASEAWKTVAQLVTNSLAASPTLSKDEMDKALEIAASVGRPLIAGGHLDRKPLVLVAASLHLSIKTVSGDESLEDIDGETSAVPGAATAKDWTLFLPTPKPLTELVKAAAKKNPHLSTEEPPRSADESASKASDAIDVDALRRRG